VAARKAFKNHRNKNRERTQRPLGDGKKWQRREQMVIKLQKYPNLSRPLKGSVCLKINLCKCI